MLRSNKRKSFQSIVLHYPSAIRSWQEWHSDSENQVRSTTCGDIYQVLYFFLS
jgi:hypothetical protein